MIDANQRTVVDSVDSAPAKVLAVGPLPPPVTGLSVLTEKVVERMCAAGHVDVLNMSPGNIRHRLVFRISRLLRTLACLAGLIARGRARNARLYVVSNSKSGLLTTLALVKAGRLLGYPIYLHHHAYFYIDEFDWRMAWIVRDLGKNGVHVVHSPQMADDFRARYPASRAFEWVLPSVFALPLAAPRQAPRKPLQIGHMGNLSVAKGLDLVLHTFRELRRRGCDVQLTLAGPFHTREARQMVDTARAEFPAHVSYSGPVYGEAKAEFFRAIDCFLLPSRSESWGIVLNEAMAAGVPVIACRRGCTETLVGQRAGLVVNDCTRFAQLASDQIQAWINDAALYRDTSAAAVEQAALLERDGQAQLADFARHMVAPLAAPAAARCRSHQPC